jgi:hypothetical protein
MLEHPQYLAQLIPKSQSGTAYYLLQVVKWNHMQKDVVQQRLLLQKNLCISAKINLVSSCIYSGFALLHFSH